MRPGLHLGLAMLMTLALGAARPARAAARPSNTLTASHHQRLFAALGRALDGLARAACRSERIDLELAYERMDDGGRMLFHLEGQVRVRVPGEARRQRLREAAAAGVGRRIEADGPVGFELVAHPLVVDDRDATFRVAFSLMVMPNRIAQVLIRNGAALLATIGLAGLADQAVEALQGMDVGLGGAALDLGVRELPQILIGEAGAIAYAAFDSDRDRTWKEQLKATLTPRGILRHFTIAFLFLGASKIVKAGVKTVGLAVGTALLPAGSPFLATVAATATWMWLGHRAVKAVTIKAPLYWKLWRLHRAWRKALGSHGAARERALAKVRERNQQLVDRARRELASAYKRWDFVQLLTGYFRRRIRDRRRDPEGKPPLDPEAFRPLIQFVTDSLSAEAADPEQWYTARRLRQFLEAVGDVDDGRNPRFVVGE